LNARVALVGLVTALVNLTAVIIAAVK